MPYISASDAKSNYDAVIIGSGAAGGQAAYTLTMEGAKVLVVECGRKYDVVSEVAMFQTNGEAPLRGEGTPDKPLFFHDATVNGGWEVPGEPYTNASMKDKERFWWWRSRMLGGRTNHWGRNAERYGPYDFRYKSMFGLGFDWPISYEELAPWYEKAELLIGVFGTNEDIENLPHSNPGTLLPAPKPRIAELYLKKRAKPLGIKVVPIHRAVLTQRLENRGLPEKLHPNNPKAQRLLREDLQSRSACFWATACPRGCSIRATYQSTTVHLPVALNTGNLDIITDAMAREVTLDATTGKASGVVFIDKKTGIEHRVTGRTVILAGGSYESVRLMMNSKSRQFPQGLANSSGKLGKYIVDTISTSLGGQIPALENLPPHNEDGAGGHHIFIPWWLHAEQKAGKLGFAGCYETVYGNGRSMPSMGTGGGLDGLTGGSFGKKFKQDARRYYGSFITLKGQGNMFPNEQSFCALDSEVKDKWGIPVLKFNWQYTDQEVKQAAHMQKTFAEVNGAMGGRVLGKTDLTGGKAITPGGFLKHEVGGANMGFDARSSVTNKWGQTWDVPNLFVADGALFSANSEKPPTLTILALAWRTADHVLEKLRKGEV